MHLDVGVAMWQLLVPPSRWQHIGAWCEFLTEHHKRAISRDTWTQLLDFMQVGVPLVHLMVAAVIMLAGRRLSIAGWEPLVRDMRSARFGRGDWG